MKYNSDYRREAREALSGNWLVAALTSFLVAIIGSATCIISIFITNPLSLGYDNSMRANLTKRDSDLLPNSFKFAFNERYLNYVGGLLIRDIYIILWTCLLIIPGIIMTFAYAMTPYILTDRPELSVTEAITESRRMMHGHKFDLFCLYLSFIGWAFLCILTLGIGAFWLAPYISTAKAAFYEDLKTDERGKI